MQSGKDDEDLQKALALSLEPLEDRTGAEFGSLLTWCKKGFRHGSAQFTILRSCRPQAYSFPAFCLTWGHFNHLQPFCSILDFGVS